MDLADLYRIFDPISAQYTLFSGECENFSKIDYILGHKASLSKYKKIEMIPYILSDQNTLKLELNNKNNDRKHANNWKLNSTLLNDQWVIDEIQEEIKRLWQLMKMKTQPIRTFGTHYLTGSPERKFYSNECIY
jgi:hypothetical protein